MGRWIIKKIVLTSGGSILPFDSGFLAKSTNRDLKGLRLTLFEALKLRPYKVFQSLGVYHDVKLFYNKY